MALQRLDYRRYDFYEVGVLFDGWKVWEYQKSHTPNSIFLGKIHESAFYIKNFSSPLEAETIHLHQYGGKTHHLPIDILYAFVILFCFFFFCLIYLSSCLARFMQSTYALHAICEAIIKLIHSFSFKLSSALAKFYWTYFAFMLSYTRKGKRRLNLSVKDSNMIHK